MKKEFTARYIYDNKGCYDRDQVGGLSFIKKESIDIMDLINSEMKLKDKFWFVFRKCELELRQKQDLCILLAETVLEIYEKKYPDNKAPREAIQAAKAYLNGTIGIDVLREKRRAAAYDAADAAAAAVAAAADAAAYAAAAVAAAADAYDAAYADAAAYAAAAYAAAADAAAAAAAAAYAADAYKTKLLNVLIEFVNNQQ